MLLVNNLSFKRNNNIIFHNVSFSVASKKIIHLTGKKQTNKIYYKLLYIFFDIVFCNFKFERSTTLKF